MFVDSSRLKDLAQLKAWMEDWQNHSLARRRMYKRTYDKIMSQLHDEKLAALRERLTKATFAEDKAEMWKLTNQIKDYCKEERVVEWHE